MFYINGTLKYVQASAGIETGVKNNRVPRNSIRGGNGTFLVANPPQIYATFGDDDGSFIRKDCYSEIKSAVDGRRKVTEKFVIEVFKIISADGKFGIDGGTSDMIIREEIESAVNRAIM